MSIEWSRIFPRPTWGVTSHAALREIASPEGIAFYHQLFAAMKAREAELLGEWLDGWFAPGTRERIRGIVEALAKRAQ